MEREGDVQIAKSLADNFDLRTIPPDFYGNPFPYYDALRSLAPVKLLPDGGYFLTRFKDCETVYKLSLIHI